MWLAEIHWIGYSLPGKIKVEHFDLKMEQSIGKRQSLKQLGLGELKKMSEEEKFKTLTEALEKHDEHFDAKT